MKKISVFFLLAGGLLAVSTASLFARMIPELPAVAIAFWRMGIASSILWLYTGGFGRGNMSPSNRRLSVLAGIFLGLHFACFFGALKYTSIANATVLSSMAPVFTSIVERFYYGRAWNWKILAGLFMAIIGVVIIQGGHLEASSSNSIGNLLGIGAAVCIAVVLLISEDIRRDTGVLIFSRTLYLVGGVTVLFIALISGKQLIPEIHDYFYWLILLGIVPTVLGHTSFYHAIKFVPPTVVAAVPLAEPLVASTFGWILLGEQVSAMTVIGGFITLAGLLVLILQQLARNKKRPPAG